MATSGSIDFAQTRNDIIKDAYILLGVYGEQESISGGDNELAARTLNAMIKAWQGRGINLFSQTEATVFLEKGKFKYSLNSATATGDEAANESEVVETTTTAAASAGASTIDVTTATGMAASDIIGIVLDDGTMDWDTIQSISSLEITLTGTLTSAAASGNRVYNYTNQLAKPMDITDIRLRNDGDTDRTIERVSREEYFSMSDKDSQGKPTMFYYDRQHTTGELYVWPTPDSVNDRLKITYTRTLEDFDAASDNPDLPQEWIEAMKYQLAVRLAPAFGKDQKLASLGPLASSMLETMLEWDNEHADLSVIPDTGFNQ